VGHQPRPDWLRRAARAYRQLLQSAWH
jgi:hypothetical protein